MGFSRQVYWSGLPLQGLQRMPTSPEHVPTLSAGGKSKSEAPSELWGEAVPGIPPVSEFADELCGPWQVDLHLQLHLALSLGAHLGPQFSVL